MTTTQCLLLLCALTTVISGSVISFNSTPTAIQTYLTRSMLMTCDLNKTESGAAIVGRSVTQTDQDAIFITSVVITRNNGDHVAYVNTVTPATALLDLDNMVASGSVAGHERQQAYLSLLWAYPTEDQVGVYTCEVNAMDAFGHNTVFTKQVELTLVQPTLTDLVHHIRDLAVENVAMREKEDLLLNITQALKDKDDILTDVTQALQDKDNQLSNITNTLIDMTASLQDKDDQLSNATSVLTQQLSVKDQEIQTLNDQIANIKHVENGTLDCFVPGSSGNSYSDFPGREGDYGTIDITHQFANNYTSPPVVHLGVVNYRKYNFDTASMTYSADFVLELLNVTEAGFSMRCKVWHSSTGYDQVNKFSASWISITQ